MSARDLWTELAAAGIMLSESSGQLRVSAPQGVVTPELRARIAVARDGLLALAFLDANPHVTRAVFTDIDTDPSNVIVTIGIRGKAIGEVVIPRERYDGGELLKMPG